MTWALVAVIAALVLFFLVIISLLHSTPQITLDEQAACIRRDAEEKARRKRQRAEKRARRRERWRR